MDNSYLYFAAAEIDYRRKRATRTVKPRRRRGSSPWNRRQGTEPAA